MGSFQQIIDVFSTRSKQNSLFLWVFYLFLGFNPVMYADDLSESMAQLDQITTSLEKLEQQITNHQTDHEKIQKELAKLDRETDKLHKELAKFAQRHDMIKARLAKLEDDRLILRQQLAEQNARLQRQVRLAYLAQQQSPWKDVINKTGIQPLGVKRQMYAYINNARLLEMQNLTKLADDLNTTTRNLNNKQQELTELVALNRQQLDALGQVRLKKDQAQKILVDQLANVEARYKEEQKKQKELRKLVEELSTSEVAIISGSFHRAKGSMSWPVQGKVLNKFGRVKSHNADDTWEGVATAANRGSEIRAIFNGQVIFSDYLQGYGWLLIIDHGDEFMSLYAHAETLLKTVGDKVASDEVVALVGDSGNVTSPTMYFEIRRQGAPVNPQEWCKSAKLAYAE